MLPERWMECISKKIFNDHSLYLTLYHQKPIQEKLLQVFSTQIIIQGTFY
jgi:hypothetical protein